MFGGLGIFWAVIWYWWYRDQPSEKPEVTAAELAEIGPAVGRAHHGLAWGIALRNKNLWMIMLMYHTYCWGSYFYLSWLHTYLQKGRGFTTDEMKFYSVLPFIAGAIGNLTGGWLSDVLVRRYGLAVGRKAVGTTGLALSAICVFGTGVTPDRYVAVALLTLGYFSMDCMLPPSWAICMDVGRQHAGTVAGAMNMAGQFGSFISAWAFGRLVEYFGGNYNYGLMFFGFMLAVSAFLFTRIDPTKPLVPDSYVDPRPQPALAR
jgi:predicted MFS family arabinose efflux permease